MQGCSPPLMAAPQVEAVACPTQGKNLKPICMGPLQDTKKVTNLEQPKYIYDVPKLKSVLGSHYVVMGFARACSKV